MSIKKPFTHKKQSRISAHHNNNYFYYHYYYLYVIHWELMILNVFLDKTL